VRVSWFGLKTKVDGLLVVWYQNRWVGFPGLSIKTGSFGLVICASKSPRQFLDLGLKTKRAIVCWWHHKTGGGMKTAWGTRQDLTVCFTWKQVGLGFPSLASIQVEAQCGWCTWHHRGGCI
jgi:hypothetical protein